MGSEMCIRDSTKAYFRYQELRHKPEALAEEIRKWWRWRRECKPKRVFVV